MSGTNFVFMSFPVETIQGSENRRLAMNSFKIQNCVVQTFTNETLTIKPNVGLDEWNKLCINEFSIRDHPGFGQSVCF
jgi:hypothetical protein